MFNLVDKHSKATVINMFKEPKGAMSKVFKQGLIATSHKIQNKRNYKKKQIEVEKYTIQIKILLQKLNNRFELLAENQ